jgi:hypothetical protein
MHVNGSYDYAARSAKLKIIDIGGGNPCNQQRVQRIPKLPDPGLTPVVAAAFHPALAPVGALLGTLGYATGTGLAWLTGLALRHLAGAG